MKKLLPTPTPVGSTSEALVDVDFLTDLVQKVDRCVLRLAEVEGSILRLEGQQTAHGEAHRLSGGVSASVGSLGAAKPLASTTVPLAHPAEVEVIPDVKASALLVKISYREGCTVESVRAMLSGKTERLPNGRRSAPRGSQFATLRDASGEAGIPLTRNVHMLGQLAQPYRTFPTLYGAIRSGRKVRIT